MVKKIALLFLVIGAAGIAFLNTPYGKKLVSQKDIGNDSLSERSKEFVAGQRDDNELWNTADFDEKGPIDPTTVDIDGCFSITIPYVVSNTRKDRDCDYQISTTRPRTNIIAYRKDVSIGSLDDDPGVRLRRSRTETYDEYTEKIGNKSWLIFSKKEGAYERQAHLWLGSSILVVSIQSRNIDDLTSDFHAMLDSVQLP